jgi:hypothetical protein
MSRLFGNVIQNGCVVRDIATAMRHWIEVLGVGPWFYIEHLPVPDFQYKGQPSPVDISRALANSGALQIELIQQCNDTPSLYLDFLQAGHEACNTSATVRTLSTPMSRGCSNWAIPLAIQGVSAAAVPLPIC